MIEHRAKQKSIHVTNNEFYKKFYINRSIIKMGSNGKLKETVLKIVCTVISMM